MWLKKRDKQKMDIKMLLTVFTTVFMAELGDKTQLATMLFASDKEVNKLAVFMGASIALITTSAIGVLVGGAISNYISEKYLNYIVGLLFVCIGIWTIFKA
jgi:putative Ca2+/H+ antiporter (TMEM165/GDT1 family)